MTNTYHQLGFSGICHLLSVLDRDLFFCTFLLPMFDITASLDALLDNLLNQVLSKGKRL